MLRAGLPRWPGPAMSVPAAARFLRLAQRAGATLQNCPLGRLAFWPQAAIIRASLCRPREFSRALRFTEAERSFEAVRFSDARFSEAEACRRLFLMLKRHRKSDTSVTGLRSGWSCGILGLDSAYGKPQLGRRFTRLAHEWAGGEFSYSENWFEKLSFAAACPLNFATSLRNVTLHLGDAPTHTCLN
jgi:hypothetical protein